MSKIGLSLVITAPLGMSKCFGLEDLLAEVDGESLELIVADSVEPSSRLARPGLHHIFAPGASVFELRRLALMRASKDWIVLSEDHCKAQPGFLRAYRNAIESRPDAILFSGTVINATSTSPEQWANFLSTGLHRYWPPAKARPGYASISNLALRRDALSADELTAEGGFETLTLPRLAKGPFFLHCPDAVVDHIQLLPWWESLVLQFHSARSGGSFLRKFTPWHAGLFFAKLAGVPFNRIVLHPLRMSFAARCIGALPRGMMARLMAIGVFSATGLLLGYFFGPGDSPRKVV